MRERALLDWSIMDPNEQVNHATVMSRLIQMARRANMFDRYFNMSERLLAISEEALRRSIDARINIAAEREIYRGGGFIRRFYVWTRQKWRRYLFDSQLEEMKYRENATPLSRVVPTVTEALVAGTVAIVALGITFLALRGVMRRVDALATRFADFGIGSATFVRDSAVHATAQMLRSAREMRTLSFFCPVDPSMVLPHHDGLPNDLQGHTFALRVIRTAWQYNAYLVMTAPLLEEMAKRAISWLLPESYWKTRLATRVAAGVILGEYENVTKGLIGRRRSTRWVLHAGLASLPYWTGVWFHSMWNLCCVYDSYMAFAEMHGVIAELPTIITVPSTLTCITVPTSLARIAAMVAPLLANKKQLRDIEIAYMAVNDVCLDGLIECAPTQPAFQYKPGDIQCVPKLGCYGFWGIAGQVGTVFRNCSHNEAIALCGRVGKRLPVHTDLATYTAMVNRWTQEMPRFHTLLNDVGVTKQYEPMNFNLWASSFPPARREALLRIGPYPTDFILAASAFIKREIAVKSTIDKKWKDPRWIQGCPLELSCSVGPYLRPWVKTVRDAFMPTWERIRPGTCKQVVYTCGLNAVEVGECLAKAIKVVEEGMEPDDRIIVVEDDQSRFDLHLTAGAFKLLASVYRRYLPNSIAHLLRRKISKGRSKLGSVYSVPYTMQSGWPDTSIGDTLINICMKYAAHRRGRNWISIVCGDDSVTITTARELARLGGVEGLRRVYESFGMEIEMMTRDDILDAEFCSGRFFPCQDTYVLMPRSGRILAKICWDMFERGPRERIEWLRSIASTMEHYGLVDPLCASLAKMLRSYVGAGKGIDTESEYKYYVGDTLLKRPTPSDVGRYYYHHYHICYTSLMKLADVIESSKLGMLCTDVRLSVIAEKDCA